MLGRIALAGAVLMTLGAPSAFAAPFIPFWALAHQCANLATSSQCAVQVMVNGTNDIAYTAQSLEQKGVQLGLTYQEGTNNLAYTGQDGTNQASLTVQTGDNNRGYTYQNGSHQLSTTVQSGNGGWSSTSSVGSNTSTHVNLGSF